MMDELDRRMWRWLLMMLVTLVVAVAVIKWVVVAGVSGAVFGLLWSWWDGVL